MSSFLKDKEEVLALIDKCIEFTQNDEYSTAGDKMSMLKQSLLSRELKIVVVGEARRGKSTLLNALLNLDKDNFVFPVDISVCTNVVTIVRYGRTEKIKVFAVDPLSPDCEHQTEIKREEISDYVTEEKNPSNYKCVKRIEIELPNKMLQEGVVIIDTPGVGSINSEHSEVTYGYLPVADLMLFVGDAMTGFTETELKLLKRGVQFCSNVIYPLTKTDLNASYDIILDDNRKKIADTLNVPDNEIKIVPVSAKAKIDSLNPAFQANKKIADTLYSKSNFGELENAIWDKVSELKTAVFLSTYLEHARSIIYDQIENLNVQSQLILSEKSSDIIQLTDNMKKSRDELDELLTNSIQWQSQLSLFFANLGCDINNSVVSLKAELAKMVNDYLQDQQIGCCSAENYNQLLADINDKMMLFCVQTQKNISKLVQDEMISIHDSIGIPVISTKSLSGVIVFAPTNSLDVTFKTQDSLNTVLSYGRVAKMGMLGGTASFGFLAGAIGGVIGLITGGPAAAVIAAKSLAGVGIGLGSVVGAGMAIKDASKKADPQSIATLRNALTSYINQAYTDINTSIQKYINETHTLSVADFQRMIKEKRDTLGLQISSIEKNMSIQANEKNSIVKKMKIIVSNYSNLNSKLSELLVKLSNTPKEVAREKRPTSKEDIFDFLKG